MNLPEDLAVMNCAGCGRVMHRSRATAQRYRLRVWGGNLAGRPNCSDCMLERLAPTSAVAPEKFRSQGQVAKLPPITGLARES